MTEVVQARIDRLLRAPSAAVLAVYARRFLGRERGERWTSERTTAGVIVRLPVAAARTWDLSAILPD